MYAIKHILSQLSPKRQQGRQIKDTNNIIWRGRAKMTPGLSILKHLMVSVGNKIAPTLFSELCREFFTQETSMFIVCKYIN